jgi:uncharacterized membrane protein YcaP (DUF421 family)
MDTIWNPIESALGLDAGALNAGQMAARAVLTFAVTILIIRLGAKRLFGKGTAFDFIVSIMIGSILSGAITGSTPMLATWVAGATLVGLHWLLAWLTARVDWIGPLVKGNPIVLISEGEVQPAAMREAHVSRHDLEQGLLGQGHLPDPLGIALARLERDGTISVVPKEGRPTVRDITVEDGVQTVRIAME